MSLFKVTPITRHIVQYGRPFTISIVNGDTFQHTLESRYFITERKKHSKALKNEKEKFGTYVIERYVNYVKNYTTVLEERFPTAMKMYRVFSIGIKDFLRDLKTYISLRIRIAKDKGFSKLSHKEIELYYRMPLDMWKIAPVLILSAIPFGNYVIFPLAFLKPRILLCSHFWSIQQKAEFAILELQERLKSNKPVFRALQAKLDSIPNGPLKEKWTSVIASLGSGRHPSSADVLSCKEMFTGKPYHLDTLGFSHMGYLLKMHGLRKGIFRRKKLKRRAFILLEMDRAIIREGGVETLTTDGLRNACYIRGLNSSHLNKNDMKTWLNNWLKVSACVDRDSYSLLLHCQILFSYNHPQNWKLIY